MITEQLVAFVEDVIKSTPIKYNKESAINYTIALQKPYKNRLYIYIIASEFTSFNIHNHIIAKVNITNLGDVFVNYWEKPLFDKETPFINVNISNKNSVHDIVSLLCAIIIDYDSESPIDFDNYRDITDYTLYNIKDNWVYKAIISG